MSKIIRFPIVVNTTTASENSQGVCPQLEDIVRPISGALTTALPSERAVRDAIETITLEASGSNLGTGEPIFISTSGNNHVNFYTLSGMGLLSVTSDENNVILNTSQAGSPSEAQVVTISNATINGGVV